MLPGEIPVVVCEPLLQAAERSVPASPVCGFAAVPGPTGKRLQLRLIVCAEFVVVVACPLVVDPLGRHKLEFPVRVALGVGPTMVREPFS